MDYEDMSLEETQPQYKWGWFLTHILPLLLIVACAINRPYLGFGFFLLWMGGLAILDSKMKAKLFSFEDVLVTVENDGRLSPLIYELATLSYLILYWTALAMIFYKIHIKDQSIGWFILLFPTGVAAFISLVAQHELMHKNNIFEKSIARFVGALHFWNVHEYEHLYHHHNNDITCSSRDMSYARLNQSLYSYLRQVFIHNYIFGWKKQRELLKESNIGFFNAFKNMLLFWSLISIAVFISVYVFMGVYALLFYIFQALIGISIFLTGTYAQHYGLTRRTKSDGSIETFTYMNIWNCRSFVSNIISINNFHHGHHHLFQMCRYPHLKIIQTSPIYPFDFMTLMLIMLFPPIWFKKVNPLVEEVFKARDEYEKQGLV